MHDEGQWQQRQGRLQWRAAGHELQILEGDEEEPEGRQELDADGQAASAETPHAEQPRIEQRGFQTPLPDHEGDAGRDAQADGTRCQRVGPATLRAFDDAEDERGDGDQRQDGPHEVERRRLLVDGARDDRQRTQQGHDREGHVEPEERRPGEPLQKQSSDEEADDRTAARDADPDTDGLAAFLFGEGRGDDREGGGHDGCGSDAHEHTEEDELVGLGDEEAKRGSRAEDDEAGREQQLAAVAVAQRTGEEQQAGEDHGVGVDDPCQLRLGRAGITSQAGQGHVEATDRRDHRHERQADDHEDESPACRRELGRAGHEGC